MCNSKYLCVLQLNLINQLFQLKPRMQVQPILSQPYACHGFICTPVLFSYFFHFSWFLAMYGSKLAIYLAVIPLYYYIVYFVIFIVNLLMVFCQIIHMMHTSTHFFWVRFSHVRTVGKKVYYMLHGLILRRFQCRKYNNLSCKKIKW